MQPVTLGLVGLGTIARNQHLPSIARLPQWQLVAVASRNASAEGFASFSDIDGLLAGSDCAAITLCTPPQGRFEQAAKAIAAGRHVMIEKPPGASVAEVETLAALARAKGVSFFVTWHSREAAAVEEAAKILQERKIRAVQITWKEDVRRWHPGQEWIWQAGGLGIFDPGINALSVLTKILPDAVHPLSARLEVPANKQTPIAAQIEMVTAKGAAVQVDFDWRQTGPQSWDIRVETEEGEVLLRDGGASLLLDGQLVTKGADEEYYRLYKRFAELIAAGHSEVDLRPLQLVADTFLLGERVFVEAFHE